MKDITSKVFDYLWNLSMMNRKAGCKHRLHVRTILYKLFTTKKSKDIHEQWWKCASVIACLRCR